MKLNHPAGEVRSIGTNILDFARSGALRLVTGQVMPMNPAAAVRGAKHVVKTGKTPVLDGTA